MNSITDQRAWPSSPLLRAVGRTLDEGLEVVTYEGGFVWPATKHVPGALAGLLVQGVITNGAPHEGAPAAPGTSATSGASNEAGEAAPRPADTSTSAPFSGRVEQPEPEPVTALGRYPQLTVRLARDACGGVTVSGTIQPIADLSISASLVVHYLEGVLAVRGWAWWSDGVWVGPRHTYADGSICAFELRDGTWIPDQGVESLLDLYSVWLARQLYLRAHARWPGPQRIHSPLERMTEQMPGELCGCGRATKYLYCCFPRDRKLVAPEEIARRREHVARRAPRIQSFSGVQSKP